MWFEYIMQYVLVRKMNACVYHACLLCVVLHLEAALGVMTCQHNTPGLILAHNTCIACFPFYTSFNIISAMMISIITQTHILH